MKKSLFLGTAMLFWAGSALLAQPAGEGLANRIIAAKKANAALMKQYSWSCREDFLENGKTLDTRIDSVSFGADGQPQRTVLNDDKAPLPSGFLRRKIAEDKRADVEKYLVGLRKLLDQYTLPTAGKVLDFVSQTTIQAPDANGMLQLTGNGVVVPGDTLVLGIQAATQRTQKVQITTTFEGDPVTATASFKTLPSGLNHIEFAEVDVPAKGYKLQIHNYDYKQNN